MKYLLFFTIPFKQNFFLHFAFVIDTVYLYFIIKKNSTYLMFIKYSFLLIKRNAQTKCSFLQSHFILKGLKANVWVHYVYWMASSWQSDHSSVKRILKFPRLELYFPVIRYLEGKIEMFSWTNCSGILCE